MLNYDTDGLDFFKYKPQKVETKARDMSKENQQLLQDNKTAIVVIRA